MASCGFLTHFVRLKSRGWLCANPFSTLFFPLIAKLPKPQDPEDEHEEAKKEPEVPLPQTLVRIPTQQQSLQPQAGSDAHEE
jgi:hypothetical protein